MRVKVKVFPYALLSCGLSPSPVVEFLEDHLLHGLHVEPRRADRYSGEIKLSCWLCSLLEQNILSFIIQSRIFILCHTYMHKLQCLALKKNTIRDEGSTALALLTLFTLFTLFTVFILFKLLYTA